jgi:hypothetical protein
LTAAELVWALDRNASLADWQKEIAIDISFTAYLSGSAYTVKPNATAAEIIEMGNAFSLLIPID